MANNNEERLDVVLGMVVDEKGVTNATKNVVKSVDKIAPDGRIELNLAIAKKSIKGLKKQQAEILEAIKEVSDKGGLLSVSKKEQTAYKNQVTAFRKAVGQAGQTSSDAYQEINKVLTAQLKVLKQQEKIDKVNKTYSEKTIARAQKQWANESKARREERKQMKINEREDAKFAKELAKGTSAAKSKVPGSRTNLGLAKQTPADKSIYTTQDSINKSESNPYQKGNATAEETVRREENKKTRKNTKKWIDKNYELGSGEIQEGHIKIGPGAGRATTDKQQAKIDVKNALNDLAKLFTQLEKGIKEVTDSDIFQGLDIARTTLKLSGEDEEGAYNKISSKIQSLYDQSMKKRLGGTTGEAKGVGPGHDNAVAAQKRLMAVLDKLWKVLPVWEKMQKRMYKDSVSTQKAIRNATSLRSGSQWEQRKQELRNTPADSNLINAVRSVGKGVEGAKKATESQTRYDVANHIDNEINNDKMLDTEKKLYGINLDDAGSGGNTDANIKSIHSVLTDILTAILDLPTKTNKKEVEEMIFESNNLPDLYREMVDGKWVAKGVEDRSEDTLGKKRLILSEKEEQRRYKKALDQQQKSEKAARTKITEDDTEARKRIEEERAQIEQGTHESQLRSNMVSKSEVKSYQKTFWDTLKDALTGAGRTAEVDRIMNADAEMQERMRAKRVETYGLNNGRYLRDTGDKASIRRTKELFGWIYRGDDKNKELFQDIKLTPGIKDLDTSKILAEVNKVLSGSEMFKAQTGGTLRNIIGSMTGYLGMPSLEKSRAQADALNYVMSGVRNEIISLIQGIQEKETTLRGMEKEGTVKFNDKGEMIKGTSAARKTLADLEEQKQVLEPALAEVKMIDAVISKTGGKVSEIIKQIGFLMPELMQYNTVLHNVNAGLDKNGKALKFQTRTAEILNYSFQLMSRSIGQMFKNWMVQINPLTQIKKLFDDFASYDVKWQRTMNVIKYNIRRIIRPFMEWLAQQFVNIIGLANALVKGLGKAFGKNWDLFDQSAANAEKMREELEASANVTAGFDELHDIGSDNSAAGDLMGDIYTPQWEGLNEIFENIGTVIGNIMDTISKFTFWDWLKLAGAALLGFLALKVLINWFTGKNPLQSVANGFSFLEKAVGWAILILAFTAFTKALTEFVECMKSASWEDIAKALTTLGVSLIFLVGASGGLMKLTSALGITAPALFGLAAIVSSLALFTEALKDFVECMKSASWDDIGKSLVTLGVSFLFLVAAAGGLMYLASAVGILAPQMLGLAVVIAAFAPVIWALSAFVEAMKGLTSGDMLNGLLFLAGAFMAIAVAIGALLVVLSTAIASGVGALAILALAGIVAVTSLVILAIANLVKALGEAGEGIRQICEGIAQIMQTIGNIIIGIIDTIIGRIVELAGIIVHEIGETIRSIVKTVGDVIIGIIREITNLIPNLLNAILTFCWQIGPAIESSVTAILRAVTKLINFLISAIEYVINTLLIGSINGLLSNIPFVGESMKIETISIQRFVPKYEKGTNYVPSDGLAYLHQGEAVIPKKYNQPYQSNDNSGLENAINNLSQQVAVISSKVDQGIPVTGEFRQRGSDLVAVTERARTRNGHQALSNPVYAR